MLPANAAGLAAGRWTACLAEHHPRLTSVGGTVGDSEHQALERLAIAVERFGCDWPLPPRMGVHFGTAGRMTRRLS